MAFRGRLHHRIYVSLLLAALFSAAGTAFVGHVLPDRRFQSPYSARLVAEAEHIGHALDRADDPAAALVDLARGLNLHAAVVDAEGRVAASTLDPPPRLHAARLARAVAGPRWVGSSRGAAVAVPLSGGRTLAIWPRRGHHAVFAMLGLFFVLLAVGSVPVARGLTRRLAALERGFDALGAGRLNTRVEVQGRDELARLAERFNASAERIERLVEAQRHALRVASHELRSPLARIRLALELIRDGGDADTERRASGAIADVAELDALVGDLLLASRMEAETEVIAREPVDLAAIAADEGGRAGARLEIQSAPITGDPRLLRRLIRNLVDNAVRHAAGQEITVGVQPIPGTPAGARLWVADRGPGVPAEDRERVFAPFHRGTRAATDSGGVGLGLALVRQIAERHGGTAVCRERDGGGAWFEIALPGTSAKPPA